ncbi:5-hydroxytryptamine receptor 3B [Biomphalaria glabrata]|nr:5-hydroxytryptamine receptor 3B [Biomphalaria glabrata]
MAPKHCHLNGAQTLQSQWHPNIAISMATKHCHLNGAQTLTSQWCPNIDISMVPKHCHLNSAQTLPSQWHPNIDISMVPKHCHLNDSQTLTSQCIKYTNCQLTDSNFEKDKFKEEASQTFNLVLHKYNPRIRPPRAYIDILMQITLSHIRHFDIHKQELQTVLDINIFWKDGRLEWSAAKVQQIIVNESIIWTPDIVITNAVAPSRSLFPSALKINSSGNVQWTRKEEVTTFCKTYPEETSQNCTISFGFLSNSRHDQSDRFFNESSSFTVPDYFSNHQWDIDNHTLAKLDREDTKGYYSIVDIKLLLTRIESEFDTTLDSTSVSTQTTTCNSSTGRISPISNVLLLLFLCSINNHLGLVISR